MQNTAGGYPLVIPKMEPHRRAGPSDARNSLCRGTACRALRNGRPKGVRLRRRPLQRRGGGGPGGVVSLEEEFGVGDGDGGALGEAALGDGRRGGEGSRRRGFLG